MSKLQIAAAVALAFALIATTTAAHYEALRFLERTARAAELSRRAAVGVLTALVGLHVGEIALYALVYACGAKLLGIGHLDGGGRTWLDYFYFAAETYSTLGYGDVVPSGALRLVASIEALNGLLLLAWSGAFLYGVLDGRRATRAPRG